MKRGRPALPKAKVRSHEVRVYLNDEELELLDAMTHPDNLDMSRSSVMRIAMVQWAARCGFEVDIEKHIDD